MEWDFVIMNSMIRFGGGIGIGIGIEVKQRMARKRKRDALMGAERGGGAGDVGAWVGFYFIWAGLFLYCSLGPHFFN